MRISSPFRLAIIALSALVTTSSVHAQSRQEMELSLPTDNTSLFSSEPANFYMYVNRSFEGRSSKPWEGGKYGFSRNPRRTAEGLVYTRLHEGVDIRPARRDAKGIPLDTVRSISDGRVVHTNNTSGYSNYGRYVVIEHNWKDGTYYSLYAHLREISVKPGQTVKRGAPIGALGWTGVGINLERAHLHLEVNLFLHSQFPRYHDRFLPGTNHHSVFNGLNLVGVDVAGLFKDARGFGHTSVAEFIGKNHPPHYRVAIPDGSKLEIVARYPWLSKGKKPSRGAWEISFSREGIPVAARPIKGNISKPTVTWVKPSKTYHSYLTKGYLTGSGNTAALSQSGLNYLRLLSGDF